MSISTLRRSIHNRMIMGVCGGIGEHYGWDPTKVRLAFALIFIFSAGLPIVIFYIICAIVVPE